VKAANIGSADLKDGWKILSQAILAPLKIWARFLPRLPPHLVWRRVPGWARQTGRRMLSAAP